MSQPDWLEMQGGLRERGVLGRGVAENNRAKVVKKSRMKKMPSKTLPRYVVVGHVCVLSYPNLCLE